MFVVAQYVSFNAKVALRAVQQTSIRISSSRLRGMNIWAEILSS
jgi:hypothetical protein